MHQLDYFTLIRINKNATNYYLEVRKVILFHSTCWVDVSCSKLIGKMLVQEADY